MNNVVALGGVMGISPLTVTWGLGGGGQPTPQRKRSAAPDGQRKFWDEYDVDVEVEVETPTQAPPWTPPRPDEPIIPHRQWPLAGEEGNVDAEADYTIVPVVGRVAVRASAAGWVTFVHREDVGMCAAIMGDNGQRYLYVGIGLPNGVPRHVQRDEVIGYITVKRDSTPPEQAAKAPRKTRAPLLLPDKPGYAITVDPEGHIHVSGEADASTAPREMSVGVARRPDWPTQADTVLLGLPIAGVAFAVGAPVLGIILGTATILIAAHRPHKKDD